MPLLLGGAAYAAGAPPATVRWFQETEQSLMDAVGKGDRAVWERVLDPSFVVTTEEGEVLTRDRFLDELPRGGGQISFMCYVVHVA